MKKTTNKVTKKVMPKKMSKMSIAKKVSIGAGLATLGAGAYYLLGPNSKIHQKKASAVVSKIKKEIIQKTKQVKNLTKPLYDEAVDNFVAIYSKQYKIHEKDINVLAKKLKSEWKSIKK